MKIYATEKVIAHKKWTIEIHTDRYGNKFVTAKCVTIYNTLEVRVEEYDGFFIPKEKHNQLIDTKELYKVRDKMMAVFNRKE
jgi:hypothetical protein